MVTDTAHRLETIQQRDGLLSKAALQLRQFVCGLHGHDSLMHFEQGRMSLLCASCGHETPGWDVKKAPVQRTRSESSSRVVHLPFARQRRVA